MSTALSGTRQLAFAAGAVLLGMQYSWAAPAFGVMSVSATVLATCAVAPTPLQNVKAAGVLDKSSSISVTCNSRNRNYRVVMEPAKNLPAQDDNTVAKTLTAFDTQQHSSGVATRQFTLYGQRAEQSMTDDAGQPTAMRVTINY